MRLKLSARGGRLLRNDMRRSSSKALPNQEALAIVAGVGVPALRMGR